MKDKRKIALIAAAAVLIIAAVAAVLLLTQKNNSELRIQNSELSVTEPAAEPTDVPTAEPTEEPTAGPTEEPTTEPTAAMTEEPAEEPTAEPAAQPEETEQVHEQPFLVQITDSDPSIAYVLVRMPDPVGLLPLPTEGEYTRTIRQTMPDGSEAINVLHLTPNGVWMEEANCEGQDCVGEGEVTLENREERVLWNMIICLPHQLALELITRDEALALIGR